MQPKTTAIEARNTIAQMVRVWNDAQTRLRRAHDDLSSVESDLNTTFPQRQHQDFKLLLDTRFTNLDAFLDAQRRKVWRAFFERMEIRSFLSVKAWDELERRLTNGELPDITEEAMWDMLDGARANFKTLMTEAVNEVFEFLRPPSSLYKTNTEYELGAKVVLEWCVRRTNYGFTMMDNRVQYVTAIDKVFHLLDGVATLPTPHGPLRDAIEGAGVKGQGETTYFKVKCFQNHNLHVMFLRRDLVARLNEIAGGNRLPRAG